MKKGVARAAPPLCEGMAARKFWVSSQPDMTAQPIAARVAMLEKQSAPELNEQTRAMLGL